MTRRTGLALLILGTTLVWAGAFLRRAGEGAPPAIQPTRLFEQVFAAVRRFGVDSLDESELFRRAAGGLLEQLDDEYAAIVDASGPRGEPADVGGLGLLLASRRGRVTILGTLPGSPAEQAGLWRGDQLLDIGERPVSPTRLDEVRRALGGEPGTAVKVRVRRTTIPGPVDFELTREPVRPFLVHDLVALSSGVGYLGVHLIREGVVREVRRQLARAVTTGTRGVILDLRGASGGDLAEGIELAGLFLDAKAPIVTEDRRDRGPRLHQDNRDQEHPGLAVVLLIDGGTADAAEVTAGALQDGDRALLVGEATYGRGLSQEVFPMGDRIAVRISTTRWVTPSGRRIQPDSLPPTDLPAVRPSFRTAGGRKVFGGGGIVPDSLVPTESLSEAAVAFYRGLGPALPKFAAAVRRLAPDIVAEGPVAADYRPGAAHRERLRSALHVMGVSVPRRVFEAAQGEVSKVLGEAVIGASLGWAGQVRLRARQDPSLKLADALLRAARSPESLVAVRSSGPRSELRLGPGT